MENNEYEFDEHGGHAPINNPDGSQSMPILGCGARGCKAAFFTHQARSSHIKATHPQMSSGASQEMITLARIRPELAEKFGISQEELNSPMNMEEFNRQQHIADVVDYQKKNWHMVSSHPIFKHIHEVNAEANMLGAAMGQNDSEPEEIHEMRDQVNQHMMQWAAGHVLGKSVDEPDTHIRRARSILDQSTWGLPDELADHYSRTFDKIFDRAYSTGYKIQAQKYGQYEKEDYD